MRSQGHRGLVACDLDGTLLRSDGTLSPRTISSIRAVQSAGWVFAIVTGRPVRRIIELAAEAAITGVAVCSNGAIVYELETGAMIGGHPIEPTVTASLIADLRSAIDGVHFAFELGLQFGRERTYPLRGDPPQDERVGDALDLAVSPAHKLIVGHPLMEFDRLLSLVGDTAGNRVEVTHSAREFVEISARGVDKSSGTRLLCDRLGIGARDVVAIGDMPNDLAMLTWAGKGVAVANAHPDVLRAADVVVAANDEDGVADLLDTLM